MLVLRDIRLDPCAQGFGQCGHILFRRPVDQQRPRFRMHQVIRAGCPNLREAWRVLAAHVGQGILGVLKAENLVLLFRDQSTHYRSHLCRDSVSLLDCQWCDAGASKEGSISTGNACFDEFTCLGNGDDGRGIATRVGLAPGGAIIS